MTDNTIKLDGIVDTEEARATGHECDWKCIQNVTPECVTNDNNAWNKLKTLAILRAQNDIKTLDSTDQKQKYDIIQAFELLLQHDAIPRKPKAHRGYLLGAREFTLTYSPKWINDAQARVGMVKAMNKLCRYYQTSIIKLRAVGEVGSNGLSHIHCFYKLDGGLKMTDKNFKRAWKYWNPLKPLGRGFEGGHHASVKEEADFLGYIDKDILTAWYEINLPDECINNDHQTASSACSEAQSEEE